jgi:hypothetical protein
VQPRNTGDVQGVPKVRSDEGNAKTRGSEEVNGRPQKSLNFRGGHVRRLATTLRRSIDVNVVLENGPLQGTRELRALRDLNFGHDPEFCVETALPDYF